MANLLASPTTSLEALAFVALGAILVWLSYFAAIQTVPPPHSLNNVRSVWLLFSASLQSGERIGQLAFFLLFFGVVLIFGGLLEAAHFIIRG